MRNSHTSWLLKKAVHAGTPRISEGYKRSIWGPQSRAGKLLYRVEGLDPIITHCNYKYPKASSKSWLFRSRCTIPKSLFGSFSKLSSLQGSCRQGNFQTGGLLGRYHCKSPYKADITLFMRT